MQIDITMKRLLSLMALCCLVFVACSNDENMDNDREPAVDKITLSKTFIEVGFEPDTYSVNVISPYSWDAFSASDWIEVVTYQGDAGVVELSFNVTTRNAELEKRMGSIVVTNSEHNLVAELYIIQNICEELAVDLGLSVKWAPCNVGANSPEGYGEYFAWGEISPKEEYRIQTYQYWTDYDGDGLWDEGEFANLGDISGNPQYDAATANWGGAWRMPTKAEQEELLNNCTWEWTTLNGVNGLRVTGPNGNSIFLPAAGYRYGTSSRNVGLDGNYWGSTPDEGFDYHADYLYFGSDYYDRDWFDRYYGQSVRPVLE